ncbi:MAG: excinuclease ABC subunit UvrA [Verrucomicrobia bacterium]|nr:excinuclease ABC subunit UvrA [Verrucomicrobiota bacterium]
MTDNSSGQPSRGYSEIHIKGARQHNLRNIEIRLPRNQLVVITGVSGSGKSSLAFDTLYAEGYRKFIDSLSTRAKSVLEQIPRPEVDFIHGLSPVIAIEQRTGNQTNPRSTVATVSEVADYARLLWAFAGEAFCPQDGHPIVRRTLDDCLDLLLHDYQGKRVQLLCHYLTAKPSIVRGEFPHLRQKGFQRVRINGLITDLEEANQLPSGNQAVVLDLVIDRLALKSEQRSRLADSLELAFREGKNRALALVEDKDSPAGWREVTLSRELSCSHCGTVYPPVTPRTFSNNHADGACTTCGGLGQTLRFAPELVVPDSSLSVRNGAVKPWRLGSRRMIIQRNAMLKQLSEQVPFDPNLPWQELDPEVRNLILHGDTERLFAFKLKAGKSLPEPRHFGGVLADLAETQRSTSSDGLRARLMAYQHSATCPDCKGSGLRAEARHVLLNTLSYQEFNAMDLHTALHFLEQLPNHLFPEICSALKQRLHFLIEVGLGYLGLQRTFNSLSGGEAQRVRLASQLGMELTGITYILDEPTIGLHAADTYRLLLALQGLRDRGNSVVVVEHDPEFMKGADFIVEVGPGAGAAGGSIVYAGNLTSLLACPKSVSAAFLSGQKHLQAAGRRLRPTAKSIVVKSPSEHNLKAMDVQFPVGLFICVTGVSGSGKSTLVNDILAKSAAMKLNRSRDIPGAHGGINGLEHFSRVVVVDQQPIGRSPRSNPATFTKVFDDLRALFAQTSLAKVRGYKPTRFSFNMRGGRCERCAGDGVIKLDMHFLADVYSECPSCAGLRYNRETLEVRYRGLNIADVLNLTVEQAADFFAKVPKIKHKLETLRAVGLGYLKLGQAANTLSGGEAQRLKLSLELSKGVQGETLYILDEPTTGLHWLDIQHLLDLLFQLRDQGNTIVVIEHNTEFIRLADWIIDLGPGGGDAGGNLLYSGPPDSMQSAADTSATAKFVLMH